MLGSDPYFQPVHVMKLSERMKSTGKEWKRRGSGAEQLVFQIVMVVGSVCGGNLQGKDPGMRVNLCLAENADRHRNVWARELGPEAVELLYVWPRLDHLAEKPNIRLGVALDFSKSCNRKLVGRSCPLGHLDVNGIEVLRVGVGATSWLNKLMMATTVISSEMQRYDT